MSKGEIRLLNLLREGGYILYARHAEATIGVDYAPVDFQNCALQRNLSNTGRWQAATYGQAIRNLQIRVSYPVSASPFCRTVETASLAFGNENVHVDPFWVDIYRLSFHISQGEQSRILNTFHSFLEQQPPEGSNHVIVAHSFPPDVGFGPIPNMGTIIVRPLGRGNGYEVIGLLTFEQLLAAR